MSQALHIANGDTLNKKLEATNNVITKELSEKISTDKIVDEAYLRALCRPPSADEKTKILKVLGEAKETEKRQVIEDTYWAVLSSKEFLFNH